MDPLTALALAADGIKIVDALINAYVASKAAMTAADIEVSDAHLLALHQANLELSAKLHAELGSIIAKGTPA